MQSHRCPPIIPAFAVALGTLVTLSLPAWSQIRGNHFLNNVRGDVVVGRYLIRPDAAYNGRLVEVSHQIRLGANGRVTLTCSNGGRYDFTVPNTYQVRDYCTGDNDKQNEFLNDIRDSFEPNTPYILSPRNTALMARNSLILEWHPVEGATEYVIQLEGNGVDWVKKVSTTSIEVPDSLAFQPDYAYDVKVTAVDIGRSAATTFSFLPATESERIQEQVAAIEAQQLEPDVEAISLALVYASFEHSDVSRHSNALNQQALEVLEERITAGTDNGQVYLLQGDIYLSVDLPFLARERYQQALLLAQAANQQELQAQSYAGLAVVAAGQTEYTDAISHAQIALQLYEALGNVEQMEALQAKVEEWEEQQSPDPAISREDAS